MELNYCPTLKIAPAVAIMQLTFAHYVYPPINFGSKMLIIGKSQHAKNIQHYPSCTLKRTGQSQLLMIMNTI